MESFRGSLKNELAHHRYGTRAEVQAFSESTLKSFIIANIAIATRALAT
jgi:hypothetical protein